MSVWIKPEFLILCLNAKKLALNISCSKRFPSEWGSPILSLNCGNGMSSFAITFPLQQQLGSVSALRHDPPFAMAIQSSVYRQHSLHSCALVSQDFPLFRTSGNMGIQESYYLLQMCPLMLVWHLRTTHHLEEQNTGRATRRFMPFCWQLEREQSCSRNRFKTKCPKRCAACINSTPLNPSTLFFVWSS